MCRLVYIISHLSIANTYTFPLLLCPQSIFNPFSLPSLLHSFTLSTPYNESCTFASSSIPKQPKQYPAPWLPHQLQNPAAFTCPPQLWRDVLLGDTDFSNLTSAATSINRRLLHEVVRIFKETLFVCCYTDLSVCSITTASQKQQPQPPPVPNAKDNSSFWNFSSTL